MTEDEKRTPCPARDGGFRCILTAGHADDHQALVRHAWVHREASPKPVRLRRLPHGDYGVTAGGEEYVVRRCGDAASATYVWEVRRAIDNAAVRTFITLGDVRQWAGASGRSAEQPR